MSRPYGSPEGWQHRQNGTQAPEQGRPFHPQQPLQSRGQGQVARGQLQLPSMNPSFTSTLPQINNTHTYIMESARLTGRTPAGGPPLRHQQSTGQSLPQILPQGQSHNQQHQPHQRYLQECLPNGNHINQYHHMVPPSKGPRPRIVSNDEKNYLSGLLSILHSSDHLTLEALRRNDSVFRTRFQIQQEISAFMKNVTAQSPTEQALLTRPMYTSPYIPDLIAFARESVKRGPASDRDKDPQSLSFDDFVKKVRDIEKKRKAQEVQASNRQNRPEGSTPGRRVTLTPKSRTASTGNRQNSSSVLPRSASGSASSKGKGKKRAKDRRSENWEYEDRGEDILDQIDRVLE